MGGLWPAATESQRKDGWKLNTTFLRKVKQRMRELDNDFGDVSEESIEVCLIAASLVEGNS